VIEAFAALQATDTAQYASLCAIEEPHVRSMARRTDSYRPIAYNYAITIAMTWDLCIDIQYAILKIMAASANFIESQTRSLQVDDLTSQAMYRTLLYVSERLDAIRTRLPTSPDKRAVIALFDELYAEVSSPSEGGQLQVIRLWIAATAAANIPVATTDFAFAPNKVRPNPRTQPAAVGSAPNVSAGTAPRPKSSDATGVAQANRERGGRALTCFLHFSREGCHDSACQYDHVDLGTLNSSLLRSADRFFRKSTTHHPSSALSAAIDSLTSGHGHSAPANQTRDDTSRPNRPRAQPRPADLNQGRYGPASSSTDGPSPRVIELPHKS
jgi:hypothetical protein